MEKKECIANVVLQINGQKVPGKRYRTCLGETPVDSGQLGIVDPCYIDDEFNMVIVNSGGDGLFKIYREETIYQAGNEKVGFFECSVNQKIVIDL